MIKLKNLINPALAFKKLKEGGPGSGPHGDDEDNPFDREPTDDEMADIEKQFEGKLNEYNRNYSELEKYETAIFDVIIQFKKIYEKSPHKKNRKINKYIQQILKIEQQLSDEITELD